MAGEDARPPREEGVRTSSVRATRKPTTFSRDVFG